MIFCGFFDFLILIAFLPNLQWVWWSLMCIFLPAFWPSSAQSLVLYQPVRLKACLSWEFPKERLVAILQEFFSVAKSGQTNLIPISGRVPVLNLEFAHCRSGFQPSVENLPKDRCRSGGFFGGFLRWLFLVAQCKRKICQPKKKSASARPPRSQAQKSATKPTNKSTCQTSKYTPGFFRLRRFALGGVFRIWILGHSLGAFWAWSKLACWNAPGIPQLLLVGGIRFAAHPSRQHF